MNDGTIQKFHIEEDHEAIIPPDMWQAVQMEIERRDAYVKAHKNNAYGQRSEVNPFFGKIVCGVVIAHTPGLNIKPKMGMRLESGVVVPEIKVMAIKYATTDMLRKMHL